MCFIFLDSYVHLKWNYHKLPKVTDDCHNHLGHVFSQTFQVNLSLNLKRPTSETKIFPRRFHDSLPKWRQVAMNSNWLRAACFPLVLIWEWLGKGQQAPEKMVNWDDIVTHPSTLKDESQKLPKWTDVSIFVWFVEDFLALWKPLSQPTTTQQACLKIEFSNILATLWPGSVPVSKCLISGWRPVTRSLSNVAKTRGVWWNGKQSL